MRLHPLHRLHLFFIVVIFSITLLDAVDFTNVYTPVQASLRLVAIHALPCLTLLAI